MPEITITSIYFAPAVAIARLGASPIPLEAFTWSEDPSSFGAGQTVIVPQISFQVLADGSIEPYLPRHLQFKDEGMIRPVCPFFELHATWSTQGLEGSTDGPLTPTLLQKAGYKLASISFSVIAANRKAAFRTGDEACSFEARGLFSAADYRRHKLLGYTRSSDGIPLVLPDHPIPLGCFQIIRPDFIGRKILGVNLDTIRIRFTPAKGQVYGPPFAIKGQTNDSRSPHLIVPPQNRILNPEASWPKYGPGIGIDPASQPADTYDGANDINRNSRSWGVVDDTCDVLITATLASQSVKATLRNETGISAHARVLVGPPHYAPDRRPFYSMVDELADRDPRSVKKKTRDLNELKAAVFDLFQRILETASFINVERQRDRAIGTNAARNYKNEDGFPDIGKNTLTSEDKVKGKCFISDFAQESLKDDAGRNSYGDIQLARSELAREQHQELADPEDLIWFLRQNEKRFREIVRPPFASLSELTAKPKSHTLTGFRDPRIPRDRAHDMRMPPYMRDSDYSALSLTRRQLQQIEQFIAELKKEQYEPQREIYPISPARSKAKTYQLRRHR